MSMKQDNPQKSFTKVKKQATQEFFNKKRTSTSTNGQKTKESFTFNKAPINKEIAKREFTEEREKKSSKRTAFTAKLYMDDNELDQIKVLAGDQFDSELDENEKKKPRDIKAANKQDFSNTTPQITSKISRLNLSKGSVALFSVSEFHPGQYAIVNHTRNVKGFIQLKNLDIKLKIGQFVVASVLSIGLSAADSKTSKKLQLSLDPTQIYNSLSVKKITPGMFLQAIVESKEEKGYFLNLGFKDDAKGFLKFTQEKFQTGDLINVVIVSVSGKLIKCSTDISSCVQSTESVLVNEHTMKAGFLVNAKIARIYQNGVEISFLGGMKGTVFVDHIGKDLTKLKVGEKVKARCISHDVSTKSTTMSLLQHVVDLVTKDMCLIGTSFEKVKVTKIVYGGSYQVRLPGDSLQYAFLHKSHLPGANKEVEDEQDPDAPKKKVQKQIDELEVGQVIDKVRVKELNYFDGVAILTMKSNIINSLAVDYNSLEIGQFVNATIESVNEQKKTVYLALNEFVKGVLTVEHMADYPIKVIPPKFIAGKQIKVRIFSIEERLVIFTKKESLMKHDVPIYTSIKQVKKGDKIAGVCVAQNEHGFIFKTFGDIKALLTFADIKENHTKKEKGEIKPGSFVKSYVLFNKKGSGLALTLDKKKAQKQTEIVKSLQDYLPNDEEILQIKEQYKIKPQDIVGQVFTFKVIESKTNYFVLKTVLEKKSKICIMPKPMSSCFGLTLQYDLADFTFDAFVFQEIDQIPIVTVNPIFSQLKDSIPLKNEIESGKTYLGIINQISDKLGLKVQFPNFTLQIAIKDMQYTSELQSHYQIGAPIIVAQNKAGRVSCKAIVLQNVLKGQDQIQNVMLNAFAQLYELTSSGFKIGQQVQGTVQLIKDYGLIIQVDSQYTGFIVNEQKLSNHYKVGQKINAVILDVDYDKKIIDLSEKLLSKSTKTIVELTKDCYMIVSCKGAFGICLIQQTINDIYSSATQYSNYKVGDEIQVRLVPNTNVTKSEFQLMTLKNTHKSNVAAQDIKEGASINGVLKSIKNHCMFIQIGFNNRIPQIGRLHQLESQPDDFSSIQIGDRISVKVLKVTQDQDRTMIELTRRKEHMDLPTYKLNEQTLSLLSLESLKEGQQLQALITDVTPESSYPVQIQISPFLHGALLFSDVVSAEQLKSTPLAKIFAQYKQGQLITVYHRKGQFSTQLNDPSMKQLKRGDLCVARYVKIQPGYGITVQMNSHSFGLIELCELSDEIQGCITKHMKSMNLFLARVIDNDKKGRLMLSSRQSVIESWQNIIAGSTAAFQQFDSKNQKQGNLRNKIIKFGPKLAINQSDIFTGYVTNISKAGCFVQIGHNCSVRVGLNELDDSETFDFKKQMPIGRQVTGRITKCMDLGEDMRFNATLRRSLVLYGVGILNRNQLKIGDKHTAFVLAVASDVVFAQLNGSYLKLKIKGAPNTTKVGQLLDIKLTKIEPENIKGDFLQLNVQQSDIDQTPQIVYDSVQEEARQDIVAAQNQLEEIDLEQIVQKKRENTAVEQQVKDLETIQQIQEEDESDDDEEMEDEDDSDAEAMQNIKTKNYDEDEDEDDDDEEMESDQIEEQEDEDVDMSEQEEEGKKITGKQALRAQITQEKEIRAKEAQMRQAKGANPQSINDFERLLVADQDQSYLWIQYMAFMLDKLDIEAARKVVERAVKSIGMTAEDDKLNLWIAFMNLENQFGTDTSLQAVVRRALEVNDNLKVYLQLINIYKTSNKLDNIEAIYKKLCKKYHESLEIWSSYIEFLFEAKGDFSEPKAILQKSLQALPKHLHINIISKFGMLQYKNGQIESGRTMFEGIVTNYPKRMDIWSIYMDMEVKHGGKENIVQARHLFERCLSLQEIQKKPRSMKLVFRKYMEFENTHGGKQKLDALRQRVEEYLEKAFKNEASSDSD